MSGAKTVKKVDLTACTVDQLVDRFAAIGVEQDKTEQPKTMQGTGGSSLK